jgi:hypothetical protein
MVEDATFFVIGFDGITEDNPIVKAYIDLCREDEVFSVNTKIFYLNCVSEFEIVDYETKECLLLIHKYNDIYSINYTTNKIDWESIIVIEENKLKENLKQAYELANMYRRNLSGY